MQASKAKFIVVALGAILVQAEYVPYHPQSAGTQGQVSKQSMDPSTPGVSALPQSPSRVVQRARDLISIDYQNGELTIDAFDAPLGDILRAICIRTGALIPVPQEANERVTRHIGPGRVIVVLGSLLNETSFNYLIEALGADQNSPVRAVLLLKGSSLHTTQEIETPVLSAAVPDPREAEEADARQKALSERSALLRQINDRHLQFVQEMQKAQQLVNPEIR